MSWINALLALMGLASSVAPQSAVATIDPVEVMVLGTYHMGNPGLDVNNTKVDSVTTPRRQRELEILADELAKFRPTRIMVERLGEGPERTPKSWRDYSPAKLATEREEAVQIAYRLADKLKIPVHGIDERDRPGEPSYFPYDTLQKFAEMHGTASRLTSLNDPIQVAIKRFEAALPSTSVAGLLRMWNDPTLAPRDMDFYYGTLGFADGSETPGADLNAQWYLRNARIFTNLMRLSKPGDRVLVVYGSGHGYWLRHFASETPGYGNVDPVPYLKRAAQRR